VIDLGEIRTASRRTAKRLGYPPPPDDLPLRQVERWRSLNEAVDRALVLNVVVSCAHGFELGAAWMWLRRAGLGDALTPLETEYLDELESGMHLDDLARRLQVEALWALLWSLSFTPELDFGVGCGAAVAPLLPDLDTVDAAGAFRAEAELRGDEELVAVLDLARCLGASLGDDELSIGFAPGEVEPYVVWERRRALEWLAGANWDGT
jgi:hypothetical protein